MDHGQKVDFVLPHLVEVGKCALYLQHQLGCESWYVACQQEHLCVVHLSRGDVDQYAVRFDSTPPVEKGIYHGSLTAHLSIIPLHPEPPMSAERVKSLLGGLAEQGHHTLIS